MSTTGKETLPRTATTDFEGVRYIDEMPFDVSYRTAYSPVYKRVINELILFIAGGGCAYARKAHAKGREVCGMCSFPKLINSINGGVMFSTHLYQRAFDEVVEEYAGRIDKLSIFNGGSFINEEIPPEFRQYVYQRTSELGIKQLMIESKPEYITDEAVKEIASHCSSDLDVMIGIGLESSNNHVRNKILQKGISEREFISAIKRMSTYGIQSFVYVLLKPMTLSEKASFEDACQTLAYLNELDIHQMALSCSYVQENTIMGSAYQRGEFRPPWLWTVLDVVSLALERNYPMTVGGFTDHPVPIAIPSNCDVCNDSVYAVIEHFRENGVLSDDSAHLSCACRTEWNDNYTKT